MLAVAEYVSCGYLTPADGIGPARRARFPLILPLLNHNNILLTSAGLSTEVNGVVQEVILRALLGSGAGQLNITTFDPLLLGTTAPFTTLRQAGDDLVPPTLASTSELASLLDELSQDVRRISDMFVGAPTTLGEFRLAAGQPIERYRLVTLLNYPAGFDERLDGLLRILMRTGPACGVSFVLHHDRSVPTPNGVIPEQLAALASTVRVGSPTQVDCFEGYDAALSPAPGQAVIEPALAELLARAKEAAAPKVSFHDLHPAAAGYWRESSAERLTAVIGRVGHQPVQITLGDEREQRHNMLVSGAVGQGKSNLLMVLVHSWAVRYSPDEVDLYLLDFKDGVTLYPLAPHAGQVGWLPHARVLGLESDRAFGSAVLQYLVDEFERRAAEIRPYADNITRYRQARPSAKMPRIVLLIDEFQVLFEEDDEFTRTALLNLERLAKKGRAYGIHLVLASQTLSGITNILTKQDGIFAQFPIRLALKNSASESRAVLDQQNTEAARLRYRGELIVNTDFGQSEANRRAVVALADPAELAELRVELWQRQRDRVPPSVFNGAQPASLPLALSLPWDDTEDPSTALLGMPVAVSPLPVAVRLGSDSGRHMSILGAGESSGQHRYSSGAAVLQTAAASIAAGHKVESSHFIIVDLLAEKSRDRPLIVALEQIVTSFGHTVEMWTAKDLRPKLATLPAELDARRNGAPTTPTYIIGFGWDRAPDLRGFDLSTGSQPVDALHAIWKEGSGLGIHMLGWWSNVRSYNDQIGLEASGAVDVVVALRISNQDVLDIFGPFISWTGESNRALFRDLAEATKPSVLIPFAPLTIDDLTGLSRRLQTG
jgi:hypothetical protein